MIRTLSISLICTMGLLACDSPEEAAPEAQPVQAAMVLKSVQAGDVACYLEVESPSGAQTMMADFERCPGGGQDVTGRIGEAVHLQTRKQSVMADACQGEPACTESQEIDLVVAVHCAGV